MKYFFAKFLNVQPVLACPGVSCTMPVLILLLALVIQKLRKSNAA
jgi:hypothetical protein